MVHRLLIVILLAAAMVNPAVRPALGAEDVEPNRLRQAMLRMIEADTAATSAFTGVEAIDPKVMAVLAEVPRPLFLRRRPAG